MADVADAANDALEAEMSSRLANVQRLDEHSGLEDCEDCGEEIPALRREKAPWARRCIQCQDLAERKGRLYRA